MKKYFVLLLSLAVVPATYGQIGGHLTGSFESNSIGYVNDKGLDPQKAVSPEDHFGSNNYLKVDYFNGRFSAGVQVEGYLPALQGYDIATYGNGSHFLLATKYVQWQDQNYSLRVGDIFEQFGNGLIFRSYEDRALGFNNSIEGVWGSYNFGGYVNVKALWGRPRLYDDYADSYVRGADAEISLSDIFTWYDGTATLGGSFVNRYESIGEESPFYDVIKPNLNLYSVHGEVGWKGFNLRGEYAEKGDDIESVANAPAKGRAYLAEIGYSRPRLSVLGAFRRLEHMNTLLTINGEGTGNVLNYLPALTRQYTYMLANLNPYQVSTAGETGGQADVYYTLCSSSNRDRYWNFHANFSTYYSTKEITNGESTLLWRDINADVERQWNKKFKTTLLVSVQEWSPSHGMTRRTYASNIFVLDMTYKFNRQKSIRAELQYLYSEDSEGDWMAALVEFNIAPKWSFYLSDMYNNGETDIHYYNGGFSYTRNRTRLQLSYGRNRAGYLCSGGVCRHTPAYTGVNLMLTSSF